MTYPRYEENLHALAPDALAIVKRGFQAFGKTKMKFDDLEIMKVAGMIVEADSHLSRSNKNPSKERR